MNYMWKNIFQKYLLKNLSHCLQSMPDFPSFTMRAQDACVSCKSLQYSLLLQSRQQLSGSCAERLPFYILTTVGRSFGTASLCPIREGLVFTEKKKVLYSLKKKTTRLSLNGGSAEQVI